MKRTPRRRPAGAAKPRRARASASGNGARGRRGRPARTTGSRARVPSRDGARPDLLALARRVIRTEARAVAALERRLGPEFVRAVEILAACRGKIIVSGVGKSGLIGHKLAATLTSTGSPAVFLHPADALHGDAGLFTAGDVALFVSKSGASDELIALQPFLERYGIPLVSILHGAGAPLARRSQVVLRTGPAPEACPMDLTPTTSITLAQVIGDCLAVALLEHRGFCADDFRFLHPGGVIGRAAARHVAELMHHGEALPRVAPTASLREVMLEIMAKRLGITTVVDGTDKLLGVISDGDFKRILIKHEDPWWLRAKEVMSLRPTTVSPDALVATAVRLMEEREPGPITALVVTDDEGRAVGILHLHDCLRAGAAL